MGQTDFLASEDNCSSLSWRATGGSAEVWRNQGSSKCLHCFSASWVSGRTDKKLRDTCSSLSLISETEIAVDSPKSWKNMCGQLPGSGGMDSLDEELT